MTYLNSHFFPEYYILLRDILDILEFSHQKLIVFIKWFSDFGFANEYKLHRTRKKRHFFSIIYLFDYLDTYFLCIFHLENSIRFVRSLFIYEVIKFFNILQMRRTTSFSFFYYLLTKKILTNNFFFPFQSITENSHY